MLPPRPPPPPRPMPLSSLQPRSQALPTLRPTLLLLSPPSASPPLRLSCYVTSLTCPPWSTTARFPLSLWFPSVSLLSRTHHSQCIFLVQVKVFIFFACQWDVLQAHESHCTRNKNRDALMKNNVRKVRAKQTRALCRHSTPHARCQHPFGPWMENDSPCLQHQPQTLHPLGVHLLVTPQQAPSSAFHGPR